MILADKIIALRRAAAPRVALATFLCILSPAVLLLLSGMSGDARFAVRGDTAAGIGLCATGAGGGGCGAVHHQRHQK